MSPKPSFECPHRWIVVTGSASSGFAFHGPFASEREAESYRDDSIACGAESAELAKLYDPRCDDAPG